MKDNLKNKIAGALYGVAVGDALGAPLEFMSAEHIAREHGRVTNMIGGGWLNLRPGETTDDTAMTLAVAEGIVEAPLSPIPAIGKRFIAWAKTGPKDIGATCHAAISRAAAFAEIPTERNWLDAARQVAVENGHRSGGNGALMRAVYPALYYTDRETAELITVQQGTMTHFDIESEFALLHYARIIHRFIKSAYDGEANNIDAYRRMDAILAMTRYNIPNILKEGERLTPTGYVVHTMECALYTFFTTDNFEAAVVAAANLGGDADTIAAVCGGLAGAYYGFDNIPDRWINALSDDDKTRLDAAIDAAVQNWTKEE